MKKAVVLAGFPGVGKSTIFKKGHNDKVILDSDSSNFSWVWNLGHTRRSNVRDLNFPQNYIDHIKDNLNKADIIFVSTHTEVLDALVKNDVDFSIVYPSKDRKEEFMELYKKRGNDEGFLKTLNNNFENWIQGLIDYPIPDYKKIELKSGEFISDIL